jgi:ketosteroid isomerase-like protein
MKTILRLAVTLLVSLSATAFADQEKEQAEKARLAELDKFWAEVSRTVKEGDFEGYSATCHPEAVLVTGTKKLSYPLTQALARWKKEFDDTKSGERESSATFRFSQRLGDATTAHETGVLLYSFRQGDGEMKHEYIHLEALLLKKDDGWKIIMEYQKAPATEEEWKALK